MVSPLDQIFYLAKSTVGKTQGWGRLWRPRAP